MQQPLTLAKLALICLGGAGWAFSFGGGMNLASYWLERELTGENWGMTADQALLVIGFNHATHYLGLFLASLLLQPLIRRWGLRTAVGGLVLSGVSLLMFPIGGPVGWFGWRLLNGMASALSLLPLEMVVSQHSEEGQRTWNFGIFNGAMATAFVAGYTVCPGVYQLNELGSHLAFVVGALAVVPSIFPLSYLRLDLLPESEDRTLAGAAGFETSRSRNAGIDWRGNFICFGTGWVTGFLEGGMLGLLPLYLKNELKMEMKWALTLIAATVAGVIAVQLPISWLEKRLGRFPFLLECYAVILISLAVFPWCQSAWSVAFLLFVMGAGCGALYPLGMSLLGHRVSPGSLLRAYAVFLAMDCVGSQMGTAAMGSAQSLWGPAAMFYTGLAAVFLVLVIAGILSVTKPAKK